MGANVKIAASLFAVLAAGCSANARFDLSEYEDKPKKSGSAPAPAYNYTPTASIPSQPTYAPAPYYAPTPVAPVYGNQQPYQASRYVAAPETASINRGSEPVAPVEPTIHVVRSGDTLWKISKSYGVSVSELYRANGLVNDHLTPGQRILVPRV